MWVFRCGREDGDSSAVWYGNSTTHFIHYAGRIAAGVSGPAAFLKATFEGAPKPEYGITIVPGAICSDEPERYELHRGPVRGWSIALDAVRPVKADRLQDQLGLPLLIWVHRSVGGKPDFSDHFPCLRFPEPGREPLL